MKSFLLSLAGLLLTTAVVVMAEEETEQSAPAAMNNARLNELIREIDPDAAGQAGRWQFKYQDYTVMVITDERADRMRVLMQVTQASSLEPEQLYRLMQANFDTALDARYAIAHDTVWATFIHPLSPLSDDEFFAGVFQTISLYATFGTSYSSGLLQFGGGDEGKKQEELKEKLRSGARST